MNLSHKFFFHHSYTSNLHLLSFICFSLPMSVIYLRLSSSLLLSITFCSLSTLCKTPYPIFLGIPSPAIYFIFIVYFYLLLLVNHLSFPDSLLCESPSYSLPTLSKLLHTLFVLFTHLSSVWYISITFSDLTLPTNHLKSLWFPFSIIPRYLLFPFCAN